MPDIVEQVAQLNVPFSLNRIDIEGVQVLDVEILNTNEMLLADRHIVDMRIISGGGRCP